VNACDGDIHKDQSAERLRKNGTTLFLDEVRINFSVTSLKTEQTVRVLQENLQRVRRGVTPCVRPCAILQGRAGADDMS